MKILVTGFAPFPGVADNPSYNVVRSLQKQQWRPASDCQVFYRTLKTSYKKAEDKLLRLIQELDPDGVLLLGVNKSAIPFSIERLAHNRVDPEKSDADGQTPVLDVIETDGPSTLQATVPVARLRKALDESGIGAVASEDAGAYLCNFSFYKLLDYFRRTGKKVLAGFVHISHTKNTYAQLDAEKKDKIPVPTASQRDLVRGAKVLIGELYQTLSRST